MNSAALAKELNDWINGSESRFALMVQEAPIGESTLRATMKGRYIPAERLEKAIRGVMKAHPMPRREKAAV